jgi:DNA-binding response OmpR family regulator
VLAGSRISCQRDRDAASSLRILLVEDEMMVALHLESIVAEFGHEVVGPVSRLEAALETARHEALDMAILDVNLDGVEVYPVADALTARGIPCLFTTGYGTGGVRAAYRDHRILQKPYRADDLAAAIAELCRTDQSLSTERQS